MRDDRRQRNAVGCHLADDDKKEVQADVEPARDGKEEERPPCVARRGEYGAAEVIKRHCRKAEGVDAKIQNRAVDQLILRSEQRQKRSCQGKAQRHQNKTQPEADDCRRMDGLARIFLLARADEPRREDIDARAHADQKAGVECGKRCRRADRAQRMRASELPDDGDV